MKRLINLEKQSMRITHRFEPAMHITRSKRSKRALYLCKTIPRNRKHPIQLKGCPPTTKTNGLRKSCSLASQIAANGLRSSGVITNPYFYSKTNNLNQMSRKENTMSAPAMKSGFSSCTRIAEAESKTLANSGCMEGMVAQSASTQKQAISKV